MQPSREAGDTVSAGKIVEPAEHWHEPRTLVAQPFFDTGEVIVVIVEDEQRRPADAPAEIAKFLGDGGARMIAVEMHDPEVPWMLEVVGANEV